MKTYYFVFLWIFVCTTTAFAELTQADLDAFMGKNEKKEPKSTYETHNTKVEMEFVYIKPGTFVMGSPHDEYGREADEVQHMVTITKGFWMQKTEVTQWQWKQYMPYNKYESVWSMKNRLGDNYAMDGVSWNEVQEFIRKLNKKESKYTYRLPTEAEWEYACRAGTTTPFSFGECIDKTLVNYRGKTPYKDCVKKSNPKAVLPKPDIGMPVASYPPNAWGIYDMHGNIDEWCQDWYWDYQDDSVSDPKGSNGGDLKVLRGGSFGWGALDCRSAKRDSMPPNTKLETIGFRLVRESR